jgi:FAD/FMN-containing dehydrogenase
MLRRSLLKQAAAAFPLVAMGGRAALAAPVGSRRVRPGEPGWPSDASWETLRQAVGGNLVKPVSPYAACGAAPASAACAQSLSLLRNPYYLGDQPGGTQVSGWLDAWTPAPSAYAVAAHSAQDVAAAVDFARRHRLRLVVKGGGHSYQGTSNAADSLLVWTRPMRDVTLHDAFVGHGCAGVQPPTPAVSVGAGAIWMDAYDAVTTKAGRYVQGGGCTTVGVAGHIQSGGFGSFSRGFGLAAGGLLEAQVVTADGRVRIANACANPDLFWALKGGGGGSFGVVTRLTLRTHDLPEHFGWASLTIKAASDDAYRRLIDAFVAFFAEALCNPHWGEQAHVAPDNTLKISMVSQGLSGAEATAVWRPFLASIAAAPQDFTIVSPPQIGADRARGWWDAAAMRQQNNKSMIYDPRPGQPATNAWWRGDQDQVSAFLHGYESVWLPASLLAADQRGRLTQALFAASRSMEVELHFNKGLAGAPEAALARSRDAATNPAALTAFALAITATGGPPPGLPGPAPDIAQAHRNAAAVDRAAAELKKVAPDAGSYVSESNYFNADWGHAFWGANYPRLRRIKAKYDPDGLFFTHHGVGSDAWSPDGFTRLA